MPASYRPRVVESELRLRLASSGAVVIEGPKACGKTATAQTLAASVVMLDVDEQARRVADIEPSLVLDGPRRLPRRSARFAVTSMKFAVPISAGSTECAGIRQRSVGCFDLWLATNRRPRQQPRLRPMPAREMPPSVMIRFADISTLSSGS